MDPAKLPAEAVPLQNMRESFPGQPGASTVVPHTTVNITSDPPKDHIIWSVCCFAYGNLFCLGLAALIFSIKARDRKVAGDLNGAHHYASTALCLNATSTILMTIMILICVIVIIVSVVYLDQMHRYYNQFNYNSWFN
uniref:Uncharacterized protein n=1 Tax=Mola mola TaxID=94237 RepID=A0A3Q3VKC8_MOLML